jgi:AraC-like DNA-binding protein
VAWYWTISWDLGDEPHVQHVLGHPVVNLAFQHDRATLAGVVRGTAGRELRGRGWALGAMFRPAGFRPLVDGPMSQLTDREVAPATVLGPGADTLHRALQAAPGWPERLALLDDFLAERLPNEPQPSEGSSALVERIAADRSLVRVDQVAVLAGVGMRRLQRLFADHVGVSPKWVIRRYRLFDAAEAAARGDAVDWSALAVELGYADQAHMVRDFTAAIGLPPERYHRQAANAAAANIG